MLKLLKLFCAFTLFIITLSVILILSGMLFNSTKNWHIFNDFLHEYALGIAIWRYSLMGVFIIFYPRAIQWLYRHQSISKDRLNRLSRRWIAIGICIFYEVIIVHNALGVLITFVQWLF